MAHSSGMASTVLHNRRLFAIRLACTVIALLTLALFVVSLPARFALLTTPTTGLSLGQPSPLEVEALARFGLSLRFFAWYELAWTVAPVLVFGAVAAVIVWHRSDDWMALLVALSLILVACVAPPAMAALVSGDPIWRVPVALVQSLTLVLLFYLLCLFPNGRFVPRAMRWLALLWTMYAVARALIPAWDRPFYLSGVQTAADLLMLTWLMLWFVIAIAAQLYRYWYISTPIQRQQTKWVVFGFVAMVIVLGFAGLLLQFFPTLREPSTGRLFYNLVVIPIAACALMLLPLSFGFAILHSRLWEIDLLINRTLVYGVLTALLGGVYAVSIVVWQSLFRTLTGQTSDLAIVASTLAIAALVQPLRRQIQAFIDRRFYRRKYDAAQTLAAFSATLRDEVNVDTLEADLIAIVQDTLQPSHVSLWLAQPPRR